MTPPRIVFMGTAELAAVVLSAVVARSTGSLVAVVSQPDRPRGRDLVMQPTPVKVEAVHLGLPILQPEKARDPAFIEQMRQLQPDLILVAAYGQILSKILLDLPRWGCLNVHTSLLPRLRGAAPIQWAIANGDTETGVTIMQMDIGLDTGPILSARATEIRDDDTGQSLHDRLARIGGELLVETIPCYLAGSIVPKAQEDALATVARKITKEDGRMDWTQPGEVLWRRLRAFTPWPGAFSFVPAEPKPRMIKVLSAEPINRTGLPGEVLQADKGGIVVGCGAGALRITELQPEGGRRLTAGEFLAGNEVTRFL
ncbi:MAG: methionyl-tRNA formyltransferase [Pedosphaera sp.]|nr:methionyl-tRNA formyltransferase [Pedosphaera sp.]